MYYRLNILNISIPPLRERKEDIETIAVGMFIKFASEKNEKYADTFRETLSSIYYYNWPGNVRELNNFVERISAIIGDYSNDEIKLIIKKNYNNNNYLIDAKSKAKQNYGNAAGDYADDKTLNLHDWEYNNIVEALKKNNLVVSRAAKDLGISRSTLIRKIKKYNINT